jgi:long-chain acyl-CoA synthetase
MTIRSCLEKFAKETPQAAALEYCRGKEWRTRTWADFLSGVRAVAEAYGSAFALRPREEAVALMLPNSPEWMEAYLACSGVGVAVVPIDPKLLNDEVAYILRDSKAAVVTTDKAHLEMMRAIAPDLPDLRAVVLTDGAGAELEFIGGVVVCDYEAMKSDPDVKARSEGQDAWYDANVARAEDVASVIYTSGTTGRPKGAMLTHGNFIADIDGALDVFGERVDSTDSLLVVLPLFHAFSFCANFVLGLFRGCTMKFVRSLYTIGEDVKRLGPSVVMSVPLLAEKMYAKIDATLQASRAARILLRLGLGRLIRRRIVAGLGGKLRFMIVGGAPCPVHILKGYKRLGITVLEGYGLTECSPVVSVAGPKCAKIGTIGQKLTNIEVRLADRNENGVGELQVKGPITMKGYWKNEAATK